MSKDEKQVTLGSIAPELKYQIAQYIGDWRTLRQLSHVNREWKTVVNDDVRIWKPIFTSKYPFHVYPVRKTWQESMIAWELRLCVGCRARVENKTVYFSNLDYLCDDCMDKHPRYASISNYDAQRKYGVTDEDLEKLPADSANGLWIREMEHYLLWQVIEIAERKPGGIKGHQERQKQIFAEAVRALLTQEGERQRRRTEKLRAKEELRNKRRDRLEEEAQKYSLEVPPNLRLVQSYIQSHRPALGKVIASIRRKIEVDEKLAEHGISREYYERFVDYIDSDEGHVDELIEEIRMSEGAQGFSLRIRIAPNGIFVNH